jgi:hypothetical protein
MMRPDWSLHCTESAADRVREATGRDIWAELGGCPRSWREAAALYRKLGVTNLRDLVSIVLGTPIDRRQAMRGDIALIESGTVVALGIVRGDRIECLDNVLPLSRAACCWRVKG